MAINKGLYAAPEGLDQIDNAAPELEIEIEDPESVSIGMDGLEIQLLPAKETADTFDANLAEYMDANELELRKVAGHRVQRQGLAHAAQRSGKVIDQGLAHLQLHRHVEVDAGRIKRVPARVVWGQLKPVRVKVRAHKAVLLHGVAQSAHAGHAFGGSSPARPLKRSGCCCTASATTL